MDNVLFHGNSADHGAAIYLDDNNGLVIKNVTLSGNRDDYEGVCSIHVGDLASLSIPDSDLVLAENQGIHLGNYMTDVLYVSPSGSGNGLTMDDAGALTSALLTHLNDGGKVIFLNGEYNLDDIVSILNKNIQFVGNQSTIRNDKKYLFIEPKMILF